LIRAKASREFWTLAACVFSQIFWIIFNPKKAKDCSFKWVGLKAWKSSLDLKGNKTLKPAWINSCSLKRPSLALWEWIVYSLQHVCPSCDLVTTLLFPLSYLSPLPAVHHRFENIRYVMLDILHSSHVISFLKSLFNLIINHLYSVTNYMTNKS